MTIIRCSGIPSYALAMHAFAAAVHECGWLGSTVVVAAGVRPARPAAPRGSTRFRDRQVLCGGSRAIALRFMLLVCVCSGGKDGEAPEEGRETQKAQGDLQAASIRHERLSAGALHAVVALALKYGTGGVHVHRARCACIIGSL